MNPLFLEPRFDEQVEESLEDRVDFILRGMDEEISS